MRGADKISELDDSVLTQILSYRPTKEAARSQILSKRWRNVWALVPVLDFDFADYWSNDMFANSNYATFVSDRSECHDNFVRIVDVAFASRQVQRVDRFSLVWKYQVKNYLRLGHPVRRWILLVLEKSPRVLSIYVQPSVANVNVPDQIFACSSLEEMKLHINNRHPEVLRPAAVNLPNLRKLNLGYYTIESNCMNELLLGCPNLVDLELFACALNSSEISGCNLKSLVIFCCCHSAEIRVSIPSLQYLQIAMTSYQPAGFVLENMTSLAKACVFFLTAEYMQKKFSNSVSKIMSGLSGVTNLDVVLHGADAKDMLKHALKSSPHFENLKALHLESFNSSLSDCIDLIDRVVEHSPVLEYLTFYRFQDQSDETELLEELTDLVGYHGNCQLVESRQGRTYGSLEELDKQLLEGMERFEKQRMEEITTDEEDEGEWEQLGEENVEGGEAEWGGEEEEEEQGEENVEGGEAEWGEEEEEGEEEGEEDAADSEEEEEEDDDV